MIEQLKTAIAIGISSAVVAMAMPAHSADPIGHMATGGVTRIVTEPGFWGGCAARISPSLAGVVGLEDCNENYVMFDCDGTTGLTTKTEATNKLANAQLSMVSGYRYYAKIDPDVSLNSVCFATRSDVLP